jgi:hypothetical protein
MGQIQPQHKTSPPFPYFSGNVRREVKKEWLIIITIYKDNFKDVKVCF